MGQSVFLEDLFVGRRFVSGTYRLDAEEIIQFASKYDPQAFHTDPERAEKLFFKGLSASGWQTAAVTMRLIVTSVFQDSGVVGMGADLAWLKPVRPGDVLRAETEVEEIRTSPSKPDSAIVLWRVETKNQDGEVVQKMTTKTVVFRKRKAR